VPFSLYKLTFSSGKSYIGQTVRPFRERFRQHKKSARTGSLLAVHCAWRMHGEPQVEILATFETQDELHAAEISAIVDHRTLSPNGYNISYGGDTSPLKNPEVAKKVAAAAIGRKYQDKARFVDAAKKLWESAEYREKVSASLKACWTPEMREKRSEISKAMWAKQKLAGWEMPESHKSKLAGRVFSDETRRKMSVSAKARIRTTATL